MSQIKDYQVPKLVLVKVDSFVDRFMLNGHQEQFWVNQPSTWQQTAPLLNETRLLTIWLDACVVNMLFGDCQVY